MPTPTPGPDQDPPAPDAAEDRPAPSGGRRRVEWVTLLVVPVVVALVVAALSPLGDGIRELIFPTRATVSGTVTMGGQSIEGAVLELDGAVVGTTDAAGIFLLTGVDDGSRVLQVRAPGAHPGQLPVTVARGAGEVRAGALDLRPLVELGFAIGSLDLRSPGRQSTPGAFVLDYDLTLWLVGDAAILDRVVSVAYVVPAPFPSATVDATARATGFCSRQSGELTFDTLLGSPGVDTVSATVGLDDATSFTIVGRPGELPAPPCAAPTSGGGSDGGTTTTGGRRGSGPATATPQPTTATTTPVTTTPGPTDPTVLSLTASEPFGCDFPNAFSGGLVLTYEVRDAETMEIVRDDGPVIAGGALSEMPTSAKADFPCNAARHTYTMIVSDAAGRRSEPREVIVEP